ncbi:MAG: sel1 repeat family protein, partial [Synergistaceae bacterium]|nr:sel1 repeat family protein [Synergistaceae bacterium]
MAEDYASLIPKLLILAQKGEAKAQYHLGVLFNDGKGVPQDFVQAAKWYTQAASQGHIKAQLYLGLLYQKG